MSRPLPFFALTVLLCLPLLFIWSVIREREERASEAEKSIRLGWGPAQSTFGPVVILPYHSPAEKEEWTGYADQRRRSVVSSMATGYLCLSPSVVKWSASLDPVHLRRGLFASEVYQANVAAEGTFEADEAALGVLPPGAVVAWERARMVLFLHDLGGIERAVDLSWGDTRALPVKILREEFLPGLRGLEAEVPWSATGGPVKFSLSLSSRGSAEWSLVPVARQAEVEIRSAWPDPSFGGERLPSERIVHGEGFRARWATAPYASNRPPSWLSQAGSPLFAGTDVKSGQISVRLEPAVGPQRMAERAVKYGFLFVGLVLGAVAMFDLSGRRLLRGVHYLGVGVALCLFFLALLALHEIWSFAFAYWAAVVLTLGSIVMFCSGLLGSNRRLFVLAATLVGGFAYLFVMLRLEDYALLAGTLALFLVLGLSMRMVRRLVE